MSVMARASDGGSGDGSRLGSASEQQRRLLGQRELAGVGRGVGYDGLRLEG